MILVPVRRLLAGLASPIDPDAYLSLLNPRWGTRLRGVVERVSPLTSDSASITIRPGTTWAGHRAGQFVTVGVDIDGVRHHRCYSLTSPPGGHDDGRIEIAVQTVEGGTVSAHLVQQLAPGDVLQLSQADGMFTLPDEIAEPLLFVTGGSGITPVMGMLRWLAEHAPGSDVVVLHHATDRDRCMFLDELERLGRTHDRFEVRTTFTREHESGPVPHLDGPRLDELCADWRTRDVYACGPTALLDFATTHWESEGLGHRLHLERFVTRFDSAPVEERDDASPPIARFRASDVDALAGPSTPLLEVAEDAGLIPASGCRMGICRTCSTLLEQGCVRDLRDGRTVGPGQHVQICVAAAEEDVVLDL
jgi:stearoyl-CoA 9-desaturase NADPH oxidoreductase